MLDDPKYIAESEQRLSRAYLEVLNNVLPEDLPRDEEDGDAAEELQQDQEDEDAPEVEEELEDPPAGLITFSKGKTGFSKEIKDCQENLHIFSSQNA